MRLLVLAGCVLACAPRMRVPDFPVSAEEREALVRGIDAQLREKYLFPERLDAALRELHERWKQADFRALDHAAALVKRVNQDFHEVFHDGHLFLTPAAALPEEAFADDDNPSPQLIAAQEKEDRLAHFGLVEARILAGNVGLLRLDSFAMKTPGQAQAYADAMAFVRDTDALIFDLRQNHGGDGESVAELVAYLLEKPALLQHEYFRYKDRRIEHWSAASVSGPSYGAIRPVYVLISRQTFSAAEEFAYDLQTQKRAAIVGEPSGGGANHNLFVKLGAFALSIPCGTTQNAVTGTNWEGKGVQPDVAAKPSDALTLAHKLALERLLAQPIDHEQNLRLHSALHGLD